MPNLVVRRKPEPEPTREPATLADFRRAWVAWAKARAAQADAADTFIEAWAKGMTGATLRPLNDDYYRAFLVAHQARQRAVALALRLDVEDRAHVEDAVGLLFAPDGALGPCWDEWRGEPWVEEVNTLRRRWRDGYLPGNRGEDDEVSRDQDRG